MSAGADVRQAILTSRIESLGLVRFDLVGFQVSAADDDSERKEIRAKWYVVYRTYWSRGFDPFQHATLKGIKLARLPCEDDHKI